MAMTQKFTAEEVREKAHGYSLRGDSRTAAMLDAYADTLSKPADSGRVTERMVTAAKDAYYVCSIRSLSPERERIRRSLEAALAAQLEQITDGKAQWDEVANILGADGDNVDDVIAKATALAAQGQGEAVCIPFGHGKVVITTGTHGGEPCVFLAPAAIPGVVGESAARERLPLDRRVPGESILTFPTVEQARIVADALVGKYTAPPASPAVVSDGEDDAAIDRAAHVLQEVIAENDGEPSEMAHDQVRRILAAYAAPSTPEGDGGVE